MNALVAAFVAVFAFFGTAVAADCIAVITRTDAPVAANTANVRSAMMLSAAPASAASSDTVVLNVSNKEQLQWFLDNYANQGWSATIAISGDCDLTGVTIPENGNFVLDLNGHTVSGTVENKGNLKFVDSSSDSSGKLETALTNSGTLTVESGEVQSLVQNGGTVVVSGGDIANLTQNGGTATVAGGNVSSLTQSSGTVNITGGTTGSVTVDSDNTEAVINISGGTVNKITIEKGSNFTPNITGGTVTEWVVSSLAGEGTEANPYKINVLAELKWFRDQVNAGNTYAGKIVQMTADIDLNNEEWTPIGTNDKPFKGGFDGGENTVSNLKITHPGSETVVDCVGFFGRTAGATIKNLKVNNASVTGSGRVAAVVGIYTGTMENVRLTGNIQIAAYQYVGGLVGYGYGTIKNCSVTGDGVSTSTIKKVAKSEIWGSGTNGYVGGICGWIGEGNSVINGCSVKDVTITTNDDTVGGICGIMHYGNSFTDCSLDTVVITAPDNDGYNGIIAGDVRTNTGSVNTFDVTVNSVTATADGVNLPALGKGGEFMVNTGSGDVLSGTVYAKADGVAKIGDKYYLSLEEALADAKDGDIVELLWNANENDAPISMAGTICGGKTVTITGTANVDWSKGWLYIGRNGSGNGKLIFDNAKLVSVSDSSAYGINVSGRKKGSSDTFDGELEIKDSEIELDYLINKGPMTLDNAKLLVKNGFSITGRPASETENGEDATATISLKNGSVVTVNNLNGMGLGYEGIGVMTIDGTSSLNCTQDFHIGEKGTMTVDGGSVTVARKFTNLGPDSEFKNATVKINKFDNDAALFLDGTVNIQIEDATGSTYAVSAKDGITFNDSYIIGTANETVCLLGSATFNGGFRCAYLQGSKDGVGGIVTIQEGTVVAVSYAVDFSKNYTLNGGTIKLSGGNASGDVWGCVFQNGEFVINSAIEVDGSGEATPVHFTNAKATLNGSITQQKTGGEPIYVGEGSVVTITDDAVVTTDCSVHVSGTLYSTGNVNGKITKVKDSAVIAISGGTYTVDPTPYLADGYLVENVGGEYKVWPSFSGGDGSEANPYLVANITDMARLAHAVSRGNTYAGKYFKQTEDIDLAGQSWQPIGTQATPFKGVYDGDGKTVSNMSVEGEENQGFFGYADKATLKNINLVNPTVKGTDCVGAIAGQVYSVSLVDNCHVSGTIKVEGLTNVGGIVGKYYTKVTNCSVVGDGVDTSYVKGVYSADDIEGDNVGGIMGHCGENNALVGNTVKNITVSGTRKVGGIVGIADQNTDVRNCVVENVKVETTATADYANSKLTSMSIGGLIGQYQAAGSSNDGTVTGNTVKSVMFSNVNNVTVDVGPIVGGARGGSGGMLAPSDKLAVSGNKVYMSTVKGSSNTYLMVAVAKIGDDVYYTFEEALAAANEITAKPVEIVLLSDDTANFSALENVKLVTGVEGGVTLKNTYVEDYLDFNNVTIGENVTLDTAKVFASDSENIIKGTLNVSGVYYNAYNAKTTIDKGRLTTTGMIVNRYHTDSAAGIYVYGDSDDATVEVLCGDTIGTYSGTFFAEKAVVKGNMLWIDYKKNAKEESDTYAQSTVKFVNSKVDVTSEFRFYKDASLALEGSAVTAGKVQVRQDATPVVDIDSTSTIKATEVQNLSGASLNAVIDDNGIVTFIKMVARYNNNTYATLQAALDAAKGEENIVIDLVNDATLDITAWQTLAIGGDTTKTIAINGNEKTLTFNKLNSDWNHIATANDAKLILNDMTITDSGHNNGPWNRYDLNFGCDVELNNVTATKALAFKADATLNNVTINETTDAYAIWIQSNGQTVDINGLTVNSAGRGIKIDEQYIDSPAKVELSVANAKFTTAKKAAIVVKSEAGSNIVLEDVDISDVKADSENAVWNDSDSAAVYGNIVVTGGTLAQEDSGDFVATVVADGKIKSYHKTLKAAIAAAAAGETVTLLQDLTVTEKFDLTGVNLDLNQKTLSLQATGNYIVDTVTISNGKIDISGCTSSSPNTYFTVSGQWAKDGSVLNLTDVELAGKDYVSGWAVICVHNDTSLNMTGCKVDLENDNGTGGGFIKDTSGNGNTATITIADTTLNLKNVDRGFTGGKVTLDTVNLTITGGEHGINGSELLVKDSTVSISGGTGRGITLNKFNSSIVNSTVTIDDMGEGGIRFKTANKLTVDAKSTLAQTTVHADVESGAFINDKEVIGSELFMSTAKVEIGVTTVDNPKYVAKVNDVRYTTVTGAINAANNGDTVQLLPGTITEYVAPWASDTTHASEKSIAIVGAAGFGTTMTGGLYLGYDDSQCRDHSITVKGIHFTGKGVLVACQKNVTIEDNKFTDITDRVASEGTSDKNAISVVGKDVIAVVKDNVIEGAASAGINLRDTASVTVTGNTIKNTQHNAILIQNNTADDSITIADNTLSDWGLGGEGRAIRSNGGAAATITGNVMTHDNPREGFVKVTKLTTLDVSGNYWNGKSPMLAGMFTTDIEGDPSGILKSYYTDAGKQNLVTILVSVAQIDGVYFASLKEAFAAAKDGDTVTLIADVALPETLHLNKAGSYTLDADGKKITNAGTVSNAAIMLGSTGFSDSTMADYVYTVKNAVFEGWEIDHVIRVQGATATIQGCTFNNNKILSAASSLAVISVTQSTATIEGNTFTGNQGGKVIDIGSWGNNGPVVVKKNIFTGNAATHTAIVYYNDGAGCTIEGNTFENNTVNSAGNVATVYLRRGTDCVVQNNIFKNNAVATTDATAERAAGALVVASGTAVSKNVIVGNTATAAGTATPAAQVVTKSSGYNTAAVDLSANYWGGSIPEIVLTTDGVDWTSVSYYEDEALTQLVGFTFVAQIGETKYTAIEDAINAVKDGETIKLLADIEISKTLDVSSNSDFDKIDIVIDGNGKTVKAVSSSYWTEKTWLADIAWNVYVKNLTFDGGNLGMRGVQFYTSTSTLENVTIKNINNSWGVTDYALHSNASALTVKGSLAFVDCNYGHMVVDVGANLPAGTTSTAVVDETATLTGVNMVANAKIGNVYYATLQSAVNAAKEGDTINLLAVTIEEGTVKLPAVMKNVTFKGADNSASILTNTVITAADGNSFNYAGLTFDGIVFKNSRILVTGWRNGGAVVEDFTVKNCTFRNLNDETNNAPLHFNMAETEPVKNLTFTDNVIDGATGGSKSGIYAHVTGKTTVTGNVINNVSFRPYIIQVTTNDGVADELIVTGNTFSGSKVGRAQALGNNAEGTDSVKLVVTGNIFKDITDAQQICYWNFNPAKTTADLSKNYYDVDIEANPSKIYFNKSMGSVAELVEAGVYPVYKELNADGTINTASLYMPPYAKNGLAYTKEVDGYVRIWGEANNVTAKESVKFELYSGEDKMATTDLNNVDNIIDGNISTLTWNFYYPESNDEYWTTTWENGHPNTVNQPTKVLMYVDGKLVATSDVQMNAPDNLNHVKWRRLGGVAVADLEGAGTAEAPYLIETLDELKWFRDQVNAGNFYKGKYVKLTADIDLKSEEWDPIKTFNGTFDGKNHKIMNLVVNKPGASNVGFFGQTNNGEIKNLVVENAKITGRLNVGVVAGTPYTSKYSNIKVSGHVEVNGMAYVGGVGGKNAYANWTDITVDVDAASYVKATSTENGKAYRTYVGGVIGFMGEGSHTFKNITSNIKVIGDVCDIGGIAGIAHYGNKFENVTFTGSVEAPAGAEEVGGIAGVWHNQVGNTVTFTNVKSEGTVTVGDVTTTGSIVGGAYNAGDEGISNSGSLIIDGQEMWRGVAKIGDVPYQTLQEAFKAVKANETIRLVDDITIEEAWDCRSTGAKFTVPVTIDGGGKKLTFACDVQDGGNHHAPFRFEAAATVKNIIIDMSEAVNGKDSKRLRAISAKGDLTVENCEFYGNPGYTNTRAIIFGEGSGAAVGDVVVSISNSIFKDWRYGVTDNENAQDVKSVTVVGNTFANAGVQISASETATFTGNKMDNGWVSITSYSAENSLKVVATGNTLAENGEKRNTINGADVTADALFMTPVAEIAGKKYYVLQEAITAAKDGETVLMLVDSDDNVTVVQAPDRKITIDGNGKTMSGSITVDGKSAAYPTTALTVTNMNFVAGTEAVCINLGVSGNNNTRYVSNVTVVDCTFTGTDKTAVGVKSYTGGDKNVAIIGCSATGMHSLAQLKNVAGFDVADCVVSDSKNGVSLGASSGVTIENSKFDCDGYGVRADANSVADATITDCEIKAFIPVVVRKASTEYDLTFTGSNKMEATNTDGIWCAVGTNEYGDSDNGIDTKEEITVATGPVVVQLEDAGLDPTGVYGNYGIARIGNTGYMTVAAAINAATDGQTVEIIAGEFNENVSVASLGKTITIKGSDNFGTTLTGGIAIGSDEDNADSGKVRIEGINFTKKGVALIELAEVTVVSNRFAGIDSDIAAVRVIGDNLTETIVVQDNEISDVNGAGIRVRNPKTVSITGNTVDGTDHNGITIEHALAANDGTITVRNNTLSNWGRGGDGRAIRIAAGGKDATVAENVLKHESAPEEFVKITGADEIDGSANYWNGKNPVVDFVADGRHFFATDSSVSPVDILQSYYTDEAKENLVKIEPQARIGTTYYNTLADAFTAAKNGDEVVILKAGTYALSTSGKNITITGEVDGVVFDMGAAQHGTHASLTFNNVTFNWAANGWPYHGLQHCGDMEYNNCVINGTVFLYGNSEVFNKCVFNVAGDTYNVWTYSAKDVQFNECTFNSAGKSVLIYHEGASIQNNVKVTDCDFIASAPVAGKAAIEMDSSLTAGINLTIDSATTATGFGSGNVSGNSLWNNKKGQNSDANNDITVIVNGETVLAPVEFTAQVGDDDPDKNTRKYVTLQEAIDAAGSGDTVKVLENIELTDTLKIAADDVLTLELNGKTVSQTKAQTGNYQMILNDGTLTIKDSSEPSTGKISYTDSGNGGEYVSNTIMNRGTLTLLSGTVENLSSATVAANGYPYAIDTSIWGPAGEVNTVIKGGTVYCASYSAMRLRGDSETEAVNVTVEGGTVTGTIEVQNSSSAAAKGKLTVTGGNLSNSGTKNVLFFFGNGTKTALEAEITGGDFTGNVKFSPTMDISGDFNRKFITGGAYSVDVSDFCADDYKCEQNDDGRYGILLKGSLKIVSPAGKVSYRDVLDQYANGYSVQLLADITVSQNVLLVDSGRSVTLDLNGKRLTNNAQITVKGVLDIAVNGGRVVGNKIRLDGTEPFTEVAPTIVIDTASVDFVDNAAPAYQKEDGDKTITTFELAKVDGVSYNDIRAALEAAKIEKTTLTLTADVVVETPITLAEGDSLTLDLSGKKLTGRLKDRGLFENAGELTLIGGTVDNTGSGKAFDIVNTGALAIQGTAADKISSDDSVAIVSNDTKKTYMPSLKEAVDVAVNGDTVALKKDVTINDLIKIEKAITLDLGGKTVTADSKKAFEVYADAVIKNGAITAVNRCVDTRNAVALTLENLTLTADGYTAAYGNPQPLTIGGADDGTTVAMKDVTISAEAGYGIITFVQTGLAATNCTVSGYNALYVKPGSEDSKFEFVDCDLSGSTVDNDVVDNSFSVIAVQTDDVAVFVDADSKVTASGSYMHAVSLGSSSKPVTEGNEIVVAGEIKGNILAVDPAIGDNVIAFKAEYADALEAAGFAVEAVEDVDGLVQVMGEKVAEVISGDESVAYTTIDAAMKAAQPGDTVFIYAGEYTQSLNVNKAITVEGERDDEGNNLVSFKGKLSVTADGAAVKNINVDNGGSTAGYISAKDVLIEGCSVVGGNGFRYCYTTGTVTFKDSIITGSVYGIHFDGSEGGNIVIDNCVITGWTSFAGTIDKVTMTNTEFDDGNYNYIRFYQDAVISNCTFNSKMEVDISNGATSGTTVVVDDSTVEGGRTVEDLFEGADIYYSDGITIDGEKLVRTARIGNAYYETLNGAFAAAKKDDMVELLADITLAEQIKVSDKAVLSGITFNGNGYTITADMNKDNQSVLYFGDTAASAWATGVTVSNLTITGTARFGIALMGGTSSVIQDVTIEGEYLYGINLYGTHGAAMTNCDVVTLFTNGSDDYPLNLVNTTIGHLYANRSDITEGTKVFISDDSDVKELTFWGDVSVMIDPATSDRIAKVNEAVAEIGGVYYKSVPLALASAKDNDVVAILAAGTNTLQIAGDNLTITGVVDGVVFDLDESIALNGTNVTFGSVTFDYYDNADGKGLTDAGTLTYNGCVFDGQVSLSGLSETFNGCVFNQTSADAYNVLTYGTPETAYNNCVFNCAGQSMLISGSDNEDVYNTVTVNGCDFNASGAVDGKAAIELDSSRTDGIKLVVDGTTDVTGFADGSVSGEDLWNNKMGQSTVENNDITVIVDGTTVLQPLTFVAKIGSVYYASLKDALAAAQDGAVVELVWTTGQAPIDMQGSVFGKTVTITGTADVDWSKGFLFIGRGGEGDGTVIFDQADLNSKTESASYGIHVSGREKNTSNKYNGTVVINNSDIDLDYLINKGAMLMTNSTLTVKNGFSVGGRPASETESGEDAVATLDLTNCSKLIVGNHNGMGLGYEALGVMNIDATSAFETMKPFLVTAKGTINVAGGVAIADKLTNNGVINVTGNAAIAANVTGNGWVYMHGVTLDADTKLIGAKVRFASGVNTVEGSVINDGFFQIGIGAYNGADANVDTENGVVVNVKNAEIGAKDAPYAGWVGSGFYDTDAEKAAAMTDAKYVLNIENSIAEFGYLHVSNDGVLIVDGNAAEKEWYNNSDYSFYAGDFIVNGAATFTNTDVLALYTKVSCDNGTDKPGMVTIGAGTEYEAERHNGAVGTSSNFTLYKTGVVNVAEGGKLHIGEASSVAADAALNVAGQVTALGKVANSGTIALTSLSASVEAAEGLTVVSEIDGYVVRYAEGAYELIVEPSASFETGAYAEHKVAKDRDSFSITLYDVQVYESLVIEIFDENGQHIATTSLRDADADDPTNVLIPGNYKKLTACTVVPESGLASGSGCWSTEWKVQPSVTTVPKTFKVYVDGATEPTAVWEDGFSSAAERTDYINLANVYKIASIGSGADIAYYATIQEAVNAAASGATVTVLGDVTLAATVVVAEDKALTLDLNGKTVTAGWDDEAAGKHLYAIDNNGELTLTGNGTIAARGIFNYGDLVLENGVIDAIDGNGGYGVQSYEGATFTMNGGVVQTSNEDDHKVNEGGYDATPVRVEHGATFTMNDGAVTNVCDFTYAIDNCGTTTIKGGSVKSVHSTVSNNGELTVEGGTFVCDGLEGVTAHVVIAWDGSKTLLAGGTFDGKDNYNGFNVDADAGADVEITGGEYLAVHSGSLYGDGTIAVSGGVFFDKVPLNRCAAGYAPVETTDGRYTVALLPEEGLVEDGRGIVLEGLTIPGHEFADDMEAELSVMVRLEKPAQAQETFIDYPVDLFVEVNGLPDEGIIGTEDDYIAGEFGSKGRYFLSLKGMELKNGMMIPVLATIGDEEGWGTLTYRDLIEDGEDFRYGVYFSVESTTDNLSVTFTAGLVQGQDVIPFGDELTFDLSNGGCLVLVTDANGNEHLYYSFADAVAHVTSGSTITFLEDVTESEPVTIPDNADFTIDLNGYAFNGTFATDPAKYLGDGYDSYKAASGYYGVMKRIALDITVIENVPFLGYSESEKGMLILKATTSLDGTVTWTTITWTKDDALSTSDTVKDWVKPAEGYRFFKGGVIK